MKEYTIKIGEIFTKQKAQELKEYLEAKDGEITKLEVVIERVNLKKKTK